MAGSLLDFLTARHVTSTWRTLRFTGQTATATLALLLTAPVTFAQESETSAPTNEAAAPLTSPSDRQEPTAPSGSIDDELRLRLNFNATPWQEVLEWFVEETGMSLQRDTWPAGSFSYNDTRRAYTISDALDAMNLVLSREGFALVRRGQLLLLVDLEDENVRDYLRDIAQTVSAADLDERASSDYVRVVFPIGGLDPEGAVEDLEKLRSPAGSVQYLATSRAIVAADTVGVLKSIRDVMLASDTTDGGVMEFKLQNRPAEDILELARPHLGLEDGENSGEDISLSTNLLGDRIYATGDAVKLRILKGLIEKGDSPLPQSEEGAAGALEVPSLRTYSVGTADPTVTLEVLQRLLAGMPDVRLTLDPETQAIIAYGRNNDHALIRETLDKMGGQSSEQLKVIPLRRLDPQAALLTINKYFGKTAENDVGPTVDGDPETKRLWIKGTAEEVAEVERLIQELEGTSGNSLIGERIRLLPYSGRSAEDALQQLERLWQLGGRGNRIRVMSSQDLNEGRGNVNERRLNRFPAEERDKGQQNDPRVDEARVDEARVDEARRPAPATPTPDRSTDYRSGDDQNAVTLVNQVSDEASDKPADTAAAEGSASDQPADPQGGEKSTAGADIIVQMTPQGLIVASDDQEALDEFEALLGTLVDQLAVTDEQPTVYWLKYIKADVASEMLNSILSGSGSSGGDLGGGLLGEIGGGMLGGLMGLGGGGGDSSGPIFTTSGTVSIVPDSRLNALIIQANSSDLTLVEDILYVIDREESPEDITTTPKPQLIPVVYQDAEEVANIVKGVYSERMPQAAGGGNRQPSPEDFINALRGRGRGGRGGGGGSENNKPTPIAISVDKRSNSLIVSAPPQDFNDIRDLVNQIDQSGVEMEEDVAVVQLSGNVNTEVVSNAINAILGPQATTGGSSSSNSSSSASSTTNNSSNGSSQSDIQRRIDFFRRLRESGGFSRDGSTGGRPSFGGGGTGGRPSFGGGSRGGGSRGGR